MLRQFRALRSLRNLPTNSPAICMESAAEPPFPQTRIGLFACAASTNATIASSTFGSDPQVAIASRTQADSRRYLSIDIAISLRFSSTCSAGIVGEDGIGLGGLLEGPGVGLDSRLLGPRSLSVI